MKAAILGVLSAFTISASSGNELSDADREALLSQLEEIQAAANSRVDQRYRTAMSAFNTAAGSDKTAVSLYVDCIELVNFKQQEKSGSDFREWKKKNKDELSEPGFKLALQYQLRWLILLLKAASEEPDMELLTTDAVRIVDSIVAQAEDVRAYNKLLNQSVTSTIFAKAYEVTELKLEAFPTAPLQIDQIYETLVLPPLRRVDRVGALRSKWQKLITQKGELVRQWSVEPDEHLRQGERTLEYEKFIEDVVPQLRWRTEVDVYRAGDERVAAVAMLKHIQNNLSHKSAPTWAEAFVDLLNGIDEAATASEGEEETNTPSEAP